MSLVYRSLELSPSNSTSGMPCSDLAGEAVYQRLHISQAADKMAVTIVIGIMEDMVESSQCCRLLDGLAFISSCGEREKCGGHLHYQ